MLQFFIAQAIKENKQLGCIWDSRRDRATQESLYSTVWNGGSAERQVLFYEMITGKKAVAIDIADYNDDDEALEADLKLADSQPIVCGVRAPDTHKYSVNWPKGVPLYKYDGDAGKYLLGVRCPLDQGLQSKPFKIAD